MTVLRNAHRYSHTNIYYTRAFFAFILKRAKTELKKKKLNNLVGTGKKLRKRIISDDNFRVLLLRLRQERTQTSYVASNHLHAEPLAL